MKSYHLQVILLTLFVICPFISNATDLNKLYSSNYKVFWKQWNESKGKAVTCKNYVATATFLSNAVITLNNAEVSEANAEVIEALCLNKTKCFLESLLKITTEEQAEILKSFILAPIYNDPIEIRKAMEKHWNIQKYQTIKERYQKMQLSSKQVQQT